MDCLICMVMFMSGVRIGMGHIHRGALLIRWGLLRGRTVFCVAAAGATSPGSAARRFGTTTRPVPGTSTSASGLPSPQVSRVELRNRSVVESSFVEIGYTKAFHGLRN